MRKFYVLIVVCLFITASAFSQTFYWIGGPSGNWNNGSNWSNTSGGTGGAGVPNNAIHNVIFNTAADVLLDMSPDLNSVSVAGSGLTVKLTVSESQTISVHSTNAGLPALRIDAGCTLIDSAYGEPEIFSVFEFLFTAGTKAQINGTWRFAGESFEAFTYTIIEDSDVATTEINVNGSMVIAPMGSAPLTLSDDILYFRAGSVFDNRSEIASVPLANYDQTSTVIVSGIVLTGVSIEDDRLGNLVYDCGQQASEQTLGLINSAVIQGDLNILNTNGQELVLLLNGDGLTDNSATISGDLNIQGNSVVTMARAQASGVTYSLTVIGDMVMNGSSFDLQSSNESGLDITTLYVGGNINHTNGNFGITSSQQSTAASLFNIELNGGTSQTITSTSGVFEDQNNQLTLRVNNPSGVTLLSNLTVGRVHFNTAAGGVISTGNFYLTIANPTPASASSLVVVPHPGGNGFVDGKVRRVSQSTEPFFLPTGDAGNYRPVSVYPETADATTFEGQYVHAGYSDLSYLHPLTGISEDYYWMVDRISGLSNAAVELSVPGAVNGATAADVLVVARYSVSDWRSVMDSDHILLGDETSGLIRSEILTEFSPFTVGYGLLTALPINLVSFDARKDANGSGKLSWNITDNSTPAKFDIMRSVDGIHFISIGSVAGLSGRTNYTFIDQSLATGNNYYRLQMFDKDGSVTYSNIVLLMNGSKSVVIGSMSPTIVRERARLQVVSSVKGNMQLVVTDITGRIVQNQKVTIGSGNQEIWLNTSTLSAGMFQVTGYMNGEKTAAIRFIKQ